MNIDDWPSNYTYYSDEEISDCIYIKEITNEEEALNWLQEYEVNTGTSWTVVRTYPTTGTKILFRKEWKCQFNVRQYPHVQTKSNRSKVRTSKHLACPAKINLTVSRVIRKRPRSSKAHLHSQFPCQLIINGQHNHPNNSAVILRHNKIRDDTKEKLLQLFMTGHSATSAREALKLELYIDYPEDYHTLVADNGNIPSIHAVQGLLKKTFKNLHILKDDDQMDKHLQILLSKYCEETGGSAKIDKVGDHKFVVICSPIMKRAHTLPESVEMMFVESCRNLDRQKHRVYMFLTPTPAGSIPIGCIITDVEKKEVFSAALKSLKKCFPDNSLFYSKQPIVIMTDYNLKTKGPLQEEWSDSIFLICQYKFLKSMWNWLLMTDHQIKNCDRQEMYFTFKRLVHAENEEILNKEYENIRKKYEADYPKFIKHIESIRKEEKSWVTFYRSSLPICNSKITNYTDIVFRILNDVILERVKAFNLTQLVDFILIRYEGYMERHLLDFAYGRYCTDLIAKYLPDSKNIEVNEIFQSDQDSNIYFVPNESHPGSLHIVDVQHGFCTCIQRETRSVCSHLSSVMKSFCLDDKLFMVSSCLQEIMFEVATGKKPPDDWLLSIISDFPETFELSTDSSVIQIKEEDCTETPLLCNNTEVQLSTGDSVGQIDFIDAEHLHRDSLSEEEKQELAAHFERITNSVEVNPRVFVPAVRKLLNNIRDFVRTDSSLRLALCNFGLNTYKGSIKNVNTRHRGQNRIHLPVMKRRKLCLGSKYHLQNGIFEETKLLKDHEYCKN